MEQKRYHFNIIDALVLVLVLALAAFVVLRVLRPGSRDPAPVETEAISGPDASFAPNLRFECTAYGLEPALAERITREPANRIYNSYKLYDAYIVDAAIEPALTVLAGPDGQALSAEDPTKVHLRLTVEAYVDPQTLNAQIGGNFNALVGTQEVRLGKPYTLKTMTVELPTTVTQLEILEND